MLTDPTNTRRIIMEYYMEFYGSKFNIIYEMGTFLKRHKLLNIQTGRNTIFKIPLPAKNFNSQLTFFPQRKLPFHLASLVHLVQYLIH